MFRLADGVQKLSIPERPAAVLWRAGAPAVNANRVTLPLLPRQNPLDQDLVLPPIAEIAAVEEPILIPIPEDRNRSTSPAFRPWADAHETGLPPDRGWHTPPPNAQLVDVAVAPRHGCLENAVELDTADVVRQLDSSPYASSVTLGWCTPCPEGGSLCRMLSPPLSDRTPAALAPRGLQVKTSYLRRLERVKRTRHLPLRDDVVVFRCRASLVPAP
jgi:hypothetical protein